MKITILVTCVAIVVSTIYYFQQNKTKTCIAYSANGENLLLTEECQWTSECAEIQAIMVSNPDAPSEHLKPAQGYFLGHCLGYSGAVASMNIDKRHLPELVASVQKHMQWNELCTNNMINKKLYNNLYQCGVEVEE